MKRALAILHSPKSLLDFIWYYCVYGKEYDWDLIAIPHGVDSNGEWVCRIIDSANTSGLFSSIVSYNNTIVDKGLLIKAKTIMEMLLYAVVGKQEMYSKKKLKKIFDEKQYDVIVTVFLGTIFSGMILSLAETKEVVLLEDGSRDYVLHRHIPTLASIKREGIQRELAGFVLSKMNYADPTISYWFSPTKNCEKFSSRPNLLRYKNYKSIKKLNDMALVDKKEYRRLIEKTFPIGKVAQEFDIALFTAPMEESFNINVGIEKIVSDYISNRFKPTSILIKKHSRDNNEYVFDPSIHIYEVESKIPGELFIHSIDANRFIFLWPSTLMMELNDNANYHVLYIKSLQNQMYNRESILNALNNVFLDATCILEI